jgi:monothiol glutaredoxin
MNTHNEIHEEIHREVTTTPIVLYMKGTKQAPMCGFSSVVVQILQKLNVPFKDINVLANEAIRQGIKDYAQWPTIPQLYIKGEFVGGCDIVRELYQTGELEKMLTDTGILSAE